MSKRLRRTPWRSSYQCHRPLEITKWWVLSQCHPHRWLNLKRKSQKDCWPKLCRQSKVQAIIVSQTQITATPACVHQIECPRISLSDSLVAEKRYKRSKRRRRSRRLESVQSTRRSKRRSVCNASAGSARNVPCSEHTHNVTYEKNKKSFYWLTIT